MNWHRRIIPRHPDREPDSFLMSPWFLATEVVLTLGVPLLVGVTIWAYVGALREDRAIAAGAQASKDSSE